IKRVLAASFENRLSEVGDGRHAIGEKTRKLATSARFAPVMSRQPSVTRIDIFFIEPQMHGSAESPSRVWSGETFRRRPFRQMKLSSPVDAHAKKWMWRSLGFPQTAQFRKG